jgi:Rieske Fe-S protein
LSESLNRREFLKIGGSAVAVVALSHCGGTPGPSVGVFAGGSSADYNVGTVRRFADGPFFVIRDDGGLYAMSAVCPHQGCTVNTGSTTLSCPCHGAAFDLDGIVTSGPAQDNLVHYDLTVDSNGDISIDTGTEVGTSTRVSI